MNKEAQKEKWLKQRAYLENLISYNQKFFNPNDITALDLINYLQPYQQAFLRLKNEEAKKIDSTIDDGHAHFISHANLFEHIKVRKLSLLRSMASQFLYAF